MRNELGPRILVAEDVDTNRKVLGLTLNDLGCRVAFARDGEEVLSILSSEDFDLILMDCQMPKLDGLAATKKVRELTDPTKSRIVIIALTANASVEDRERCLAVGMDDYLSKPVARDRLSNMISKWLPEPHKDTANQVESPFGVPAKVPADILSELDDMMPPGSSSLAIELLTLFESKRSRRMAAIDASLAGRDLVAIETSTHVLKSAASALGGGRLGDACDLLLQSAQTGDFGAARAAFVRIETLLDELRASILQRVESRSRSPDSRRR